MVIGIGARIDKRHSAEAWVDAIRRTSWRSTQTGVDSSDGSVCRQSSLFRESGRRGENTRAKSVYGIRALQVVALRANISGPKQQTAPYGALNSQVPLLDLRIAQPLIDGAQCTEALQCRSESADCSPASLYERRCPGHHVCERIRAREIGGVELIHEGGGKAQIRDWI